MAVPNKFIKSIAEQRSGGLYFTLLLAFFLPLMNLHILPGIAVAWLLWYIFFQKNKKYYLSINLKGTKNYAFIFICCYYLIHLVSLLYSNNKGLGLAITGRITSLVVVVFLVYASDIQKKQNSISLVFHGFITGCLFASFYILFNAITAEASLINSFNSLNNYHHTYFSLFLNLSIVFSLFYSKKQRNTSFFHPFIYLATIFLCLFVIFMLRSRAGILTSMAVLITWIIYELYSKSKFYFIHYSIIVLFIAGFAGISLTKNKELSITWKKLAEVIKQKDTKKNNYYLVRLGLWNASWEIIKDHPLVGVGCGDVKDEIKDIFRNNKNLKAPRKRKYNAHNQFLNAYVGTGIIGFLSLMGIFISGFIHAFRQNHKLLLAFLLLAGFNLLFESMLNRYAGIYFFSLFFSLLIIMKRDSTSEEIQKQKNRG